MNKKMKNPEMSFLRYWSYTTFMCVASECDQQLLLNRAWYNACQFWSRQFCEAGVLLQVGILFGYHLH